MCNDTEQNDTKHVSYKNFPTSKRPTMKYPSHGEKLFWPEVITAKCPYGEVSLRRGVLTVKSPTAKYPKSKILRRKFRSQSIGVNEMERLVVLLDTEINRV